ncbi:MAG: hypothetical protein MZW92_59705 [Comamonadaceae bacterium]|nr:hypothetical protein [Comamonadaceae bacterium]
MTTVQRLSRSLLLKVAAASVLLGLLATLANAWLSLRDQTERQQIQVRAVLDAYGPSLANRGLGARRRLGAAAARRAAQLPGTAFGRDRRPRRPRRATTSAAPMPEPATRSTAARRRVTPCRRPTAAAPSPS